MDKDYLDSIEEFNDDKLPNVTLDEKEINKIKENILKVLKLLKEKHSEMDFEISLEEAFKIRESIGESAEKKIFGVENTKLMRALITEEIKEKYKIKKEDIVYEYYTKSGGESYWFWKSTVYYEFIVTKTKILIIGFDADVNITIEKCMNPEEIEGVGTLVKDGEKSIVGDGALGIKLVDGTMLYVDYKENNREKEAEGLIQSIRSLGVKDIKSNASKFNREVMIFYIVTFVIGIWMMFEFL